MAQPLHEIIARTYFIAKNNKGTRCSNPLPNGLVLYIRCNSEDGKNFTLGIGRPDVWPSLTEWETVCNHFQRPGPILDIPQPDKVEGTVGFFLHKDFIIESYAIENLTTGPKKEGIENGKAKNIDN